MDSSPLSQPARDSILRRMDRLGIRESDLEEQFSRSSGPGGQNVNKVSTAVTLRYRPANISVTVQDSRSQAMNRQLARERLLDALEAGIQARRAERRSIAEKTRRQNRKRPRGLKERILEGKKKRSATKKWRSKINE